MTIMQVIQQLANAYVTRAQSLGHGKTHQNDVLVNGYCNQLKAMGFDVPNLAIFSDADPFKDYLSAIGVFNGDGSH